MPDFLGRMARRSAARALGARVRESEAALARRIAGLPAPPPVPLGDAPGGFAVIAEIKRRSPSDGRLVDGLDDVGPRARAYAAGGAAMLSVLTEPSAFHGCLADVSDAAHAVAVPVLRKDFLVDPYQVLQARAAGAGAVLLIVRLLDDRSLASMLEAAARARLTVLLEAFDEPDLERAAEATGLAGRLGVACLVGVNARDLATLQVDPERHARLAARLPTGVPAVAESGIRTPADARRVAGLGYRAVLVGSALMRTSDPAALVRALLDAGRETGGIRCAYA